MPRSPSRSSLVLLAFSALAALSFVSLAGCAGDVGQEPLGEGVSPVVVCHASPTVEGIDVSEFQGAINWAQVKASGRAWAYARISDGSYMDKTFDANWPAMKAAGVLRGAYQFFEPGGDATAQANTVVSKIGKLGAGDLPAMIDVEATGGQTAATIASKIATWISIVEKGTGKKPVIYTGKYFWQDNVADTSQFVGYDLWLAAYVSGCPNTPDAWSDWKIWQYTSTGSISGISGNVDHDVYAGTLADLQKLAGAGVDYAAKYVSQSWPLASTSLKMTAGQTIAADITLQNVGGKAWDANTKLATSNPRDRASVFAASDWLSDHRLDAVSGSVAPGASYKFTFSFHAPSTPGSYHEFFNLVEEGTTWFSDPSQGGPADDVMEAWIEVAPGPAGGDAGPADDGGAATDAGPSTDSGAAGDGATSSDAAPRGNDGHADLITDTSSSGGCSSVPARGGAGGTVALGALGLSLALAASRRRRTRA
jgi:lysozyme